MPRTETNTRTCRPRLPVLPDPLLEEELTALFSDMPCDLSGPDPLPDEPPEET